MDALGPELSEFKENTTATIATLVIGLACIALGVLMLKMTIFWDEDAGIFNRILFCVGGLASLVGGVSCVILFWQNRGGRVALHERGVLVERRGERHTALWDEITAVTEKVEKVHVNGQHIYDRYLYTIEKTGGESFALSNMVKGVSGIGSALKEKTFERLYAQASQAIERGEKVSFGSLKVDMNGLEEGSKKFLWTQLAAVKIKDGQIEIKERGGKAVIKALYGLTPNAHVLLVLLHKHLTLE
jgi:hypothetical protein